MTGIEFSVLLAWLLLPPVSLASVALLLAARVGAHRATPRRLAAAWFLLLALSIVLALIFVQSDAGGVTRHLGVRDAPVMWAPFAFIAVALALGPAIWLARSGKMRPNPSFKRTPDGAA